MSSQMNASQKKQQPRDPTVVLDKWTNVCISHFLVRLGWMSSSGPMRGSVSCPGTHQTTFQKGGQTLYTSATAIFGVLYGLAAELLIMFAVPDDDKRVLTFL